MFFITNSHVCQMNTHMYVTHYFSVSIQRTLFSFVVLSATQRIITIPPFTVNQTSSLSVQRQSLSFNILYCQASKEASNQRSNNVSYITTCQSQRQEQEHQDNDVNGIFALDVSQGVSFLDFRFDCRTGVDASLGCARQCECAIVIG